MVSDTERIDVTHVFSSTAQGSRVSETCRSGAKIEFALLQLARVSFPREALATVTLSQAARWI
jgi:hypothetical protein